MPRCRQAGGRPRGEVACMLMTQGGGRRAGPLLVVSRLSQARMVLRMVASAPR